VSEIADLEGIKAKLLARIKIVEGPLATPCWIWQGAKNWGGHGQLKWEGRNYLAHRVSWRVHYGAIVKRNICQRCDRNDCIRPDHLAFGTRYTVLKERGRRDDRAQITEEKAVEVKRLLTETSLPPRLIAYKAGVPARSVYAIKYHEAWGWFTDFSPSRSP